MQHDGQAQERAQAKLERNRRWFKRKISTFLVRAANAPVRAANTPYGELHTSTNSHSSDHEHGEHTTKRLWSGRFPLAIHTKTGMLFGQHFDGEPPRNLKHVFLRQFGNGFNKKTACLCSKIKMTEPPQDENTNIFHLVEWTL